MLRISPLDQFRYWAAGLFVKLLEIRWIFFVTDYSL